jgi:hypothetical protein
MSFMTICRGKPSARSPRRGVIGNRIHRSGYKTSIGAGWVLYAGLEIAVE